MTSREYYVRLRKQMMQQEEPGAIINTRHIAIEWNIKPNTLERTALGRAFSQACQDEWMEQQGERSSRYRYLGLGLPMTTIEVGKVDGIAEAEDVGEEEPIPIAKYIPDQRKEQPGYWFRAAVLLYLRHGYATQKAMGELLMQWWKIPSERWAEAVKCTDFTHGARVLKAFAALGYIYHQHTPEGWVVTNAGLDRIITELGNPEGFVSLLHDPELLIQLAARLEDPDQGTIDTLGRLGERFRRQLDEQSRRGR